MTEYLHMNSQISFELIDIFRVFNVPKHRTFLLKRFTREDGVQVLRQT